MTSRITALSVVLLMLIITSCGQKSEFPGFSVTDTGIHYRLNRIGEEGDKAKPGDYITVEVTYKTTGDSVFFNGVRKFRLSTPSFPGSVEECFMMLSEGDNCDFIISASDFFKRTLETELPGFLDEEDKMVINAEMINIQSEDEYHEERNALLDHLKRYDIDADIADFERIDVREGMGTDSEMSAILFYRLREGSGNKISEGDTVVFHYTGKFLDGTVFDSTKEREEPFEFIYGHEGQLIKGLEKVMPEMRRGGKSLAILPPQLAFGEKGSSTGIIPPSASLLFEIEILSVK